ncbi:hypothetical protein M440DRAFT_1395438 [Trichoderma longibrachiatum ATCC 18648]|uniref:Extracellular membrane protein CFEM domain-containing protein n=1 Tax=Trichoderma longibrachiatum ATCC 18648 TaxID=983965 RepID=A0A2T4BQY0_TRILO|nr:hypothetical protein M440DRAFT_1395438 [Trichoderma longibrachiatum ATCC 18648]
MMRLALLPLLTGVALAATGDATLTSTGCADSSGFESCQKQANDKLSSCIAQAKKDNSQQELLACGCQNYVDNYNCYSASCWNRVWECEYQEYIIDYFLNCPIAKLPVPYFPAPNKAPDECSCNIGKVFLAIQEAIQETATCSNNANSGDASSNLQQIQGCDCCEISGALSSLYNICPDTDPKLIGLSNVSQLQSQLNTDFNSCGSYLETYDCVADLGYSLDGVSKYYKPTDTVPSGTATLSNAAGTVTSPASGTVFSYTNGGDGTVYTITAAGHVQDSGDSDSGSGSNSDSSGSQTTGSRDAAATTASSQGSATAASPTETGSKKSGAGVAAASLYLAVVAIAVPLVACF